VLLVAVAEGELPADAVIVALGHLPAEGLTPQARDDLLTAFRNWDSG
jgi:hypothetical protein